MCTHARMHRMGSDIWTSSGRWLWLFCTGKKNDSKNRWRMLFRNIYKQHKRQDRKDLSMYFTDPWKVLMAISIPWVILWLRSIILMVDFSIPTLRFLLPADSAHPPAADEESHKMNHSLGRIIVQRPSLTTFPPHLGLRWGLIREENTNPTPKITGLENQALCNTDSHMEFNWESSRPGVSKLFLSRARE